MCSAAWWMFCKHCHSITATEHHETHFCSHNIRSATASIVSVGSEWLNLLEKWILAVISKVMASFI